MKNIITGLCLTFAFCCFQEVKAQSSQGDFYLSGNTGVVLPLYDNNIAFKEKLVYGIEGNYFVTNGVTVSGGIDYYTAGNNGWAGIAFGSRYYPGSNNFFIRHRAVVSTKSRYQNDFMVGVGNDFPLNDLFSAEVNADYHFVTKSVGIKAGLVMTF